ncbi:MAG: hypothetical protein IT436_06570 [Phycisphaerales bacterium]|nr:hypothetical protein [Phycisphaerales bacterium]
MARSEGHLKARRRIRRALARAVLALVAGAMMTVLVAWAVARFVRLSTTGVEIYSDTGELIRCELHQWKLPGVNRVGFFPTGAVLAQVKDDDVPFVVHDAAADSLRRFLKESAWPGSHRAPDPEADPSITWAGVIQDARGWPMPALGCEWTYDSNQMFRWPPPTQPWLPLSGGIALKSTTASNDPSTFRALPYLPIWPGLLADTAFYAILISLAVFTVGRVRGFLRLRRNRCPSCGYSLAGLTTPGCPECGWKRPE